MALLDLYWSDIWAGKHRTLPDATVEHASWEEHFSTIETIATYEEARDALVSGWSVMAQSDRDFSPFRDRFGFSTPRKAVKSWLVARGVIDKGRRPGLIFCGHGFPATPMRVQLPHGPWITLPGGCFLADRDYTPTALWAVR